VFRECREILPTLLVAVYVLVIDLSTISSRSCLSHEQLVMTGREKDGEKGKAGAWEGREGKRKKEGEEGRDAEERFYFFQNLTML